MRVQGFLLFIGWRNERKKVVRLKLTTSDVKAL